MGPYCICDLISRYQDDINVILVNDTERQLGLVVDNELELIVQQVASGQTVNFHGIDTIYITIGSELHPRRNRYLFNVKYISW